MSINLEEIVERAVPLSQGHYFAVRADDFNALVAEMERLRAERHLDNVDLAQAYDFARDKATALERAAVVAWLRNEVGTAMLHRIDDVSIDSASAGVAMLLAHVANTIERGEHRREDET